MSNSWRMTLEDKEGKTVAEMTGPMDPYKELIKNDGAATVGCSYKRALQDFGKESVGFHVSLSCDQDEATINKAGQLAFMKCMEMTGNAAELLQELMRREAEKHQGG